MRMWPARIAAVSALAALGLAVAAPAHALVTYEYTGNNFDSIIDTTLIDGTYTTDMSVTGTFTVSSPLVSLSFQDISSLVVSYSFFDGRQTLDDSNSSILFFRIATDADGSPLNWFIHLFTSFPSPESVGDTKHTIQTRNDTQITDVGNIDVCTGVSSGQCFLTEFDIGLNTGSPGSWTVTSDAVAVPEPSSLALVLAGLGLLGALARRRPAARPRG